MAKIYLAARYSRREELCTYRDELEDMGHTVTSRWLKPNPAGEEKEAVGELPIYDQQLLACYNLTDIIKADIFLAFTEEPTFEHVRGTRHTEFGFALALDKMCIIVGPIENIIYSLEKVQQYPTWPTAREALRYE